MGAQSALNSDVLIMRWLAIWYSCTGAVPFFVSLSPIVINGFPSWDLFGHRTGCCVPFFSLRFWLVCIMRLFPMLAYWFQGYVSFVWSRPFAFCVLKEPLSRPRFIGSYLPSWLASLPCAYFLCGHCTVMCGKVTLLFYWAASFLWAFNTFLPTRCKVYHLWPLTGLLGLVSTCLLVGLLANRRGVIGNEFGQRQRLAWPSFFVSIYSCRPCNRV